MKAFVYDGGWAGAEIYFAETNEEGIEYHRQKNIDMSEREIARLEDLLANGKSTNPGYDEFLLVKEKNILAYYKTREWADGSIEIFEVVSGLSIYTKGE